MEETGKQVFVHDSDSEPITTEEMETKFKALNLG